jgi:hypothetical protein
VVSTCSLSTHHMFPNLSPTRMCFGCDEEVIDRFPILSNAQRLLSYSGCGVLNSAHTLVATLRRFASLPRHHLLCSFEIFHNLMVPYPAHPRRCILLEGVQIITDAFPFKLP